MGVDMESLGSSIRFRSSALANEQSTVQTVVARIFESKYFEDGTVYRFADDTLLNESRTFTELFAAFKLILIADPAGVVVGCTGFDDRFIDPRALFEALGDYLEESSWFAFKVDGHDYAIVYYTSAGFVKDATVPFTSDDVAFHAPLSVEEMHAKMFSTDYIIELGLPKGIPAPLTWEDQATIWQLWEKNLPFTLSA